MVPWISIYGSLKTDQRNHTGEKYVCLQCDKSYTQSYDLRQHQRKHTGDKVRKEPKKITRNVSETANITNAAINENKEPK